MAAPVRRCAACDTDWPNKSDYNLCPRCQRCTFASTALGAAPDYREAATAAARFKRIRDFDAKCDAEAQKTFLDWAAAMDALLAHGPTIPDPEPQEYDNA